MTRTILITGAAGKTGRALIRALQLQQSSLSLRGFVYREQHRDVLSREGVDDVVIGDVHDLAVYRRAARGMDAIYHICPNLHPHESEVGSVAIRAAQQEDVQHFVYHSVLHPQTEQMPHHWHKLRVEEQLFRSGLSTTILQPAAYMQNILAGWQAIIEEGVYRVPYAPSTRLGMVDLLDVAEAAARILTEDTHSSATYELAGSEALTQQETALILAQAINQPVVVEQEPLAEWKLRVRASGLGEYQVDTLKRMFAYYESFGFWGNPTVLSALIGRSPTPLLAFAQREYKNQASS